MFLLSTTSACIYQPPVHDDASSSLSATTGSPTSTSTTHDPPDSTSAAPTTTACLIQQTLLKSETTMFITRVIPILILSTMSACIYEPPVHDEASSSLSATTGSPTATGAVLTTPTTTTDGQTASTGADETGGTSAGATDATISSTTEALTSPLPECGNGEVEGTEECDDGNQDPGDGCEPGCVASAVCGNGEVEGTEECDDGNQAPGDGCEPGCVASAVCGNGLDEPGEVCDDGNTEDGDNCSADCSEVTMAAVCGNGMVEGDETCDDGNQVAADGCENDCTISPPVCGNGMVEGDEACDDGNLVNGGPADFCKNDCTVFVPAACKAPPGYIVCDNAINLADKATKTNAHKAMGICSDQPNNSVVISDFSFNSINNAAWQVAKGFGTYFYDHDMMPGTPDKLLYSPREGNTFLMVSTGVIKAPNAQGIVIENANSQGGNGDNGNDDGNALPAPFKSQRGSANGAGNTPFQNCDGVNDCSDTLQAQWQLGNNDPNDKLWFTFKTKVPEGTFGYRFDFVFCSAEWPTWVNTGFNDLLIAWQTDPSADDPNADPPVDPYTGNVTFIPNPNDPTKGLPLTITALDPYFDGPGYTGNEPQLAGTGFQTNACTDWFTAKGGVQPGADVTIGFFIADMSDSILATMAILDNFRWDCEGCVPSKVTDCGIQM
jgi:cysteine-rich repeat protein